MVHFKQTQKEHKFAFAVCFCINYNLLVNLKKLFALFLRVCYSFFEIIRIKEYTFK